MSIAAFAKRIEDDPKVQTGLKRARMRLAAFHAAWQPLRRGADQVVCAMGKWWESEHRRQERAISRAMREYSSAFRQSLRETGQELVARGFKAPQTLEDWEELAYDAHIPYQTYKSGKYTAADVYETALAAVKDRRKLRKAVVDAATPGRPKVMKLDKLGQVVKKMLDNGDVERYGRRWKKLRIQYGLEHYTPDQLRKRVEREEARRAADENAPVK
jgi:hypothetical protein